MKARTKSVLSVFAHLLSQDPTLMFSSRPEYKLGIYTYNWEENYIKVGSKLYQGAVVKDPIEPNDHDRELLTNSPNLFKVLRFNETINNSKVYVVTYNNGDTYEIKSLFKIYSVDLVFLRGHTYPEILILSKDGITYSKCEIVSYKKGAVK